MAASEDRAAAVHSVSSSPTVPFTAKRALLLQGPMGPFFWWLASDLVRAGIEVIKLSFNAGDSFFYRGPQRAYRGSLADFPAYLEHLLEQEPCELLVLFGDGRPFHRAAVEVAERRGLEVVVFEEGYLRPNFITAERGGVNGHSPMSRDPAFFRRYSASPIPAALPISPAFARTAWYSTFYALALTLCFWLYPRYRHHRPLNAWAETYRWLLSLARKLYYARKERGILERLERAHDQRYFVLTLQVHCDYQLKHSRFASVEEFIEEAVASFAQNAPAQYLLVVKHHPLDRAYRNYTQLLQALADRHGLGERLVYVHDLHLPTLLRHSAGTVMINSTVGLQAISYGTPVKVLGAAVYDLPGLTSQAPLEAFWRAPEAVDHELYLGFRNYLLRQNQVNGNFYRPLSELSASGLLWPKTWGTEPDK